MPLPQGKNNKSGLGRALMNRKIKDAQQSGSSALHTTDLGDRPAWMKLQSVTQEGDLEEFLNTAQMADTDFTAERRNVTVVSTPGMSRANRHNPYLLSGEEESEIKKRQNQNRQRLRVPRRPKWTSSSTKEQLDRNEKDAFLDWRRSLAELQDGLGFVLTPFERNLEVWRQLWRVMERSDLLVQIVDARNPLRFRCEDLENYVLEMDEHPSDAEKESSNITPVRRRNLLLINKADLLDEGQRQAWARYFESKGISFAFFSAANAAEIQALNEQAGANATDGLVPSMQAATLQEGSSSSPSASEKSRILTVFELEDLFERTAPPPKERVSSRTHGGDQGKLTVGLVGYPNVGKSSTINALMGAKKVSVSSTPGKTKHFQTLHLSDTTVLCDCPGLVFPQFATTAAELVVDGVLPIDQLREYSGPAELVAQRIPKDILEGIYGLQIRTEVPTEADSKMQRCTGLELLTAYAVARGFTRQGQGNPDESRAARYVLKDYVNARLLFAHPPPDAANDPDGFNAAQRDRAREALAQRGKLSADKHAGATSNEAASLISNPASAGRASSASALASANLDADFFATKGNGPVVLGRKNAPTANLQGRVAEDGTPIMSANGAGGGLPSSKKHFKTKRTKGRANPNPYGV